MTQLRAFRFAFYSVALASLAALGGCTLQSAEASATSSAATLVEPEASAPAEPVAANTAAVSSTHPSSRTVAHRYLNIGGTGVGFVAWAGGGNLRGTVTTSSNFNKRIETKSYEAIVVQVSPDQAGWVGNAMQDPGTEIAGSITTAEADYDKIETLSFNRAKISQVQFPTMTAQSTNTGLLTVKLDLSAAGLPQPNARRSPDAGRLNETAPGRRWLAGNFALAVDGLDGSIKKIDSFTVKLLDSQRLEIPNLVVTMPRIDAADWIEWADDFVSHMRGASNIGEKSGTLTFKDASGEAVGTLSLQNIGILRVSDIAGSDDVQIELYVEGVRLDL